MFKKIILIYLLFISYSYSCEDSEENGSIFLKDVKISNTSKNECTDISLLFDEYAHSVNRYIVSTYLNVRDKNGKVIAQISPKLESPSLGAKLIRTCISDEYLGKSVLVISSKQKQSVKLENGNSYSATSDLCTHTEYVILEKAIGKYGNKK